MDCCTELAALGTVALEHMDLNSFGGMNTPDDHTGTVSSSWFAMRTARRQGGHVYLRTNTR